MALTKAVVVLSGGQDSCTCLYKAVKEYGAENVITLSFNYGQRHAIELVAASFIAELAGIPKENRVLKTIPNILEGESPLVSDAELEQYENYGSLPGGLEKTFVPARNLMFLTIAANLAYVRGANNIITGVSQEDYGGYPDCRRTFIDAVEVSIQRGLDRKIQILTPLITKTKAQTVWMAMEYPGCYLALAYTHTAYDGQFPPAGHDHATLLREKGFVEAGLPDPLVARAVYRGLMTCPDTPNYKGDEVQNFFKKSPMYVGTALKEFSADIERRFNLTKAS